MYQMMYSPLFLNNIAEDVMLSTYDAVFPFMNSDFFHYMKNKIWLTTKSHVNGIQNGGDFDEGETNPLQLLIWVIFRTTQTQEAASKKF